MILKAATHISEVLNSQEVTTIMGSDDKIFWELAEQETEKPFITYTVNGEPVTKNSLKGYDTVIRIFDNSLTEAATKAEALQEFIEDSDLARWRNRGSNSGYTSGEAATAFIEINYNFKI